MNSKLIVLLITVGIALSANLNKNDAIYSSFQTYVQSNRLSFASNSDLDQKYTVYRENYLSIASNGESFKMAMNDFGLMTPSEFKSVYLTFDASTVNLGEGWPAIGEKAATTETEEETAPEETAETAEVNLQAGGSLDLRNQGLVTGVKNQGSCGCCWAFATMGALEGNYAKKYGRSQQFAEQQLLNCDTSNYGCNGGNMINAMKYLKSAGGAVLTSSLPYRGAKQTCNNSLSKAATIASYKQISGESGITSALSSTGPVAVAIDATKLQFYSSGVYSCSGSVSLNHGVLVVGYGSGTSGDYWIVKNSWGSNWGMSGYFYLKKGSCGIGQYGASVTVN